MLAILLPEMVDVTGRKQLQGEQHRYGGNSVPGQQRPAAKHDNVSIKQLFLDHP
jgi:hypothetical protein